VPKVVRQLGGDELYRLRAMRDAAAAVPRRTDDFSGDELIWLGRP
jgi:hypothetical protein